MTGMLDPALRDADDGYHVLPLVPNGKKPATEHGLKDATTDEERIRAWFGNGANYNLGIATGHDGLIVLDVDVKGGDGFASLRRLEEQLGPLPETRTVTTPSGGLHLYFRGGEGIGNSASKLAADVDLRGTGGYVVAPPSIIDGKAYVLTSPPLEATLPDAWRQAVASARNGTAVALEPETPIPSGRQDDTLYRLGCSMRAKGFGEEAIFAALRQVPLEVDPTRPPYTDADFRRLARQGAQYEQGELGGEVRHGGRHHEERSGAASAASSRRLEFTSIRDLAAAVDAMPAPSFLFQPIWAEDTYGVVGAQWKAGKTFAMADRMVSAASGTPWFGAFACERPGPVLAFLGEGGRRKLVRRLRAVAASRGLELADLPIIVCERAPHLKSQPDLDQVAEQIAAVKPVDVIIDPLYLAARGADKGDLYAMGEHLEGVQHICQRSGSGLCVSHHFNRGEGSGAERLTGAGPAEWGRVLIAMTAHKRLLPEGGEEARLKLEITGDEVADVTIVLRRRIWVDDPSDLGSTMHYECVQVEDDEHGEAGFRPTYLMEMVSRALEASTTPLSGRAIREAVVGKVSAKCRALDVLVAEGYVRRTEASRNAQIHSSIRPFRQATEASPEASGSSGSQRFPAVPGTGENEWFPVPRLREPEPLTPYQEPLNGSSGSRPEGTVAPDADADAVARLRRLRDLNQFALGGGR